MGPVARDRPFQDRAARSTRAAVWAGRGSVGRSAPLGASFALVHVGIAKHATSFHIIMAFASQSDIGCRRRSAVRKRDPMVKFEPLAFATTLAVFGDKSAASLVPRIHLALDRRGDVTAARLWGWGGRSRSRDLRLAAFLVLRK